MFNAILCLMWFFNSFDMENGIEQVCMSLSFEK